ncbi:hypothetical protein LCGC14_0395010 [marine sediment metagenome]|uniref:Terminase large subunit gp17-like C-terminal domain-containing protein n=1 Tax=marine sediment metagenome TaxID=412755 RepID=A0A0F9VKA9_9ZZZZ
MDELTKLLPREDLSPEQEKKVLAEILAECQADTKFMARLLYPHEFYAPMTDLHDELFDFLDHCPAKRKVISAPRGLTKTTVGKLLIKKAILFQLKHFIGYLTNSGDIAQVTTEGIKSDLVSNTLVRKIFGPVEFQRAGFGDQGNDKGEEKWTQKSWIAYGETMMLPRGVTQQVNGLLWGHIRPDLWIVDDLDDRQEVRNEVQRKKLREWFYGVLMYTFSQYENFQDGEILFFDTVKHEDALIVHLFDDPDWEHLALPVCTDDYKTRAPDFRSQERLDAEIKGHQNRRTMDVFAREMQCIASSPESGNFRADMFIYYSENDKDFVENVRKRLINILIWDPAKTKNPANDQTGLVVWGVDLEYNKFYVRYANGLHLTLNEQHDQVFKLAETFNIQALGIEVTSLEEHILYPFKNECIRRKKAPLVQKIIELKARLGKGELTGQEGGKEGRIRGLISFYEQGLVIHERNASGPLVGQLLGSRLRDVADAAAYLPQMLEKGVKYMMPMDAQGDTPWEIEDEYKALKNEPPMKRQVFA